MSEILEIQDKFQHDCRIASICIRGSRNSFGVNISYAICSNSRVFHNIIVFHKYLEFLELYYYLRFQNIISILNFRSIRNIKSFFLGAFASGFGFNSFESCFFSKNPHHILTIVTISFQYILEHFYNKCIKSRQTQYMNQVRVYCFTFNILT